MKWIVFKITKHAISLFYISVDLSTALTSDALQSILNNPEAVKELQKYLPSEGSDANQEENLRSTLSCPQFQQVPIYCL